MHHTFKLSINKWNIEDRPREKLANKGARNLKNEELLAILIGSGSQELSAVQLMKQVLDDNNNDLDLIGKKSIEELCNYKGIGEAKAITILAACELGRRRENLSITPKEKYNSPEKIYRYFKTKLQDCTTEEVWIMLLKQNLSLIKAKRISYGGITSASVDIRIILSEAIATKATQIVLCHNHPSGSYNPSNADNKITEKLAKAAQLIDIHFVDHIILGENGFYSYAEENKI